MPGKEVGYSWNSPICAWPWIWLQWPTEGFRPPQCRNHNISSTKSCTKVSDEKKRIFVFPGHKKVKGAIDRHWTVLCHNTQPDALLSPMPLEIIHRHAGDAKEQVHLLLSDTDSRPSVDAPSARNITCPNWKLFYTSKYRNCQFAGWICGLTFISSQCSIFFFGCICPAFPAQFRFWLRSADWCRNIHWLVHYLMCGNTANSHLKTTVAYWAKLAVIASIARMARDVGDYYYPELVDTVRIIFKDIFICIINEQCSNQEESKWKH